ncbi:MAG: glycosyltransferase family 4 protein [candidate division WOR-3 bacterium]|nr:glycosyltransferase family 4 protein [candidate division WOR-3 bacterium]
MKILLVSSAFLPYPSGISEHVYYLAQGLIQRGHQVKVLTTNYPHYWSDWENGKFPFEIIRYGKVVFLPLNKSFATFPWGTDIPFQVRKLLKREHFDVIHLHGCYPPEIGFWALHFSNTINCVTFHTVGFRKSFLLKLGGFLFARYVRKLHGKIAVSLIAQEWAKPFIKGTYRIIPNGVDCDRFSPAVPPISKKKNDEPCVLFVGRLEPRKGILVAISAFKKIQEKFPNAKLFIVGKGPLEQAARDLVIALKLQNNCRFLGYVFRKDLPRYYAMADVYISPALGGEAQGIVLLEAMACAKPVVASDIAGYREVIEDGKNGLLAQPNSADDFAQKVNLILGNTELKLLLQKNARTRAEEFAWPNIVKRIEAYYQELVMCYAYRT